MNNNIKKLKERLLEAENAIRSLDYDFHERALGNYHLCKHILEKLIKDTKQELQELDKPTSNPLEETISEDEVLSMARSEGRYKRG